MLCGADQLAVRLLGSRPFDWEWKSSVEEIAAGMTYPIGVLAANWDEVRVAVIGRHGPLRPSNLFLHSPIIKDESTDRTWLALKEPRLSGIENNSRGNGRC